MKTSLASGLTICLFAVALAALGCKKEEGPQEPAKEPGKELKQAEPGPGEAGKEAGKEEPGKGGEAGKPAESGKPAEAALPAEPDKPKGPRNALEGVEAFNALPAGTPVVVAAADPLAMLEKILGSPFEDFARNYAEYYEKAVAEVTQETGYNLLSPKTYADMGLDLHGPVGFALLKLAPVTIVVFARLTDADKFKGTLYAIAGRVHEKMEPHVVGDAMAICPKNDEEVCFVLKSGFVFLHAVDAGDEKGLAAALEFAGARPEPSLAASEGFKADVARLTFGRDFAAVANVTALLEQYGNMPKVGWEGQPVERQKKELEEIRKGENAEAIKMAEDRLAEEEAWAKKAKERREKEARMITDLFGSVKYVGFGAELSARGLKARMVYDFDPESKMAKLARPLSGSSALLKSLPEKPICLAQMNLDLDAYVEMLKTMLAPQGLDWEQVQEEFRKAVGLGLEDDVLAAFSGEIGLAFAAPPPSSEGQAADYPKQAKLWATLGLKDPAKAALVLDKLLTLPGTSMFFRKTETGWQAGVPEWKLVYLKSQGGQLVISTEEGFAADLVSGKGASFLASVGDPELKGLLSTPESYGVAMVDFGMLGNWLYRAARFAGDRDEKRAEAERVQHSEEYKKLLGQYQEVKAQSKKMREEFQAESDRLAEEISGAIGVTAAVARKEGNLYVCDLIHVVGGETLSKSASNVLNGAVKTYELQKKRKKELWSIDNKKRELKRQLDDLRMRENEAAPADGAAVVPPADGAEAAPVKAAPEGEAKVIEATR